MREKSKTVSTRMKSLKRDNLSPILTKKRMLLDKVFSLSSKEMSFFSRKIQELILKI